MYQRRECILDHITRSYRTTSACHDRRDNDHNPGKLLAEANQDRELLMDYLPWPADGPESDRRRAKETSEQSFIEAVLTDVFIAMLDNPETAEADEFLSTSAPDSLLVLGYLLCIYRDSGFTVDDSLSRLTRTLEVTESHRPAVASVVSLAVGNASLSTLCIEYSEDWLDWFNSVFGE